MTRVEPATSELTDPFWDATREHRYLVQWCMSCATPIFYPREACPWCLASDTLEWKESNGEGVVHAASVQYRPGNPAMTEQVPYVVALVELDAGAEDATIRVMSNVVNCAPEHVRIGDHVSLAWEPLTDGRNLPVFEPAPDRTGRSRTDPSKTGSRHPAKEAR
jgi:uncharacterized OB-fold protein